MENKLDQLIEDVKDLTVKVERLGRRLNEKIDKLDYHVNSTFLQIQEQLDRKASAEEVCKLKSKVDDLKNQIQSFKKSTEKENLM